MAVSGALCLPFDQWRPYGVDDYNRESKLGDGGYKRVNNLYRSSATKTTTNTILVKKKYYKNGNTSKKLKKMR